MHIREIVDAKFLTCDEIAFEVHIDIDAGDDRTIMTYSIETMKTRLVRYGDLIPCKTAFIDARTPGSDQKENFTIIGSGVSENPEQHIHVAIPHGFNIGGARQPKGCINSQHSHETAEVFLVHSGSWAFRWGENGEDGEIILNTGDVISLPVNVFRGFECVSDKPGFLFAILGGDDPGHVVWAPYVFEAAAKHGLALTENGRLIDLAAGEVIPEGEKLVSAPSAEDVAAMDCPTVDEMRNYVCLSNEIIAESETALMAGSMGVREAAILGPANLNELIGAGRVPVKHGFQFRHLKFEKGGVIPPHMRSEEEVVFVQSGSVTIYWADKFITLSRGDTFTTPIGLYRSWKAANETGAELFVVRRGDMPAEPVWAESASEDLQSLRAI